MKIRFMVEMDTDKPVDDEIQGMLKDTIFGLIHYQRRLDSESERLQRILNQLLDLMKPE